MAAAAASGSETDLLKYMSVVYLTNDDGAYNAWLQTEAGRWLVQNAGKVERLVAPLFPKVVMDTETQTTVVADVYVRNMFSEDLWRMHQRKPASVGTACSHYAAWWQASCMNKNSWALIVEEDVRLGPQFTVSLKQVARWIQENPGMQVVHLGASSSIYYQELLGAAPCLLQSRSPPLYLRVYPHWQRGQSWRAVHVGTGFKAYMMSPSLRSALLAQPYQFRGKAIELDFVNQVWELPSAKLPEEMRELDVAARARMTNLRATVIQPSVADHLIEYQDFFRGSGRMRKDAGHTEQPYFMYRTGEEEYIWERCHGVTIALELACFCEVGCVIDWRVNKNCSVWFSDVFVVDRDKAARMGVAFLMLIQQDLGSANAYWNSDQRIQVQVPEAVPYDLFLQGWNAWGARESQERGVHWTSLSGSARWLLEPQGWTQDELTHDLATVRADSGAEWQGVVIPATDRDVDILHPGGKLPASSWAPRTDPVAQLAHAAAKSEIIHERVPWNRLALWLIQNVSQLESFLYDTTLPQLTREGRLKMSFYEINEVPTDLPASRARQHRLSVRATGFNVAVIMAGSNGFSLEQSMVGWWQYARREGPHPEVTADSSLEWTGYGEALLQQPGVRVWGPFPKESEGEEPNELWGQLKVEIERLRPLVNAAVDARVRRFGAMDAAHEMPLKKIPAEVIAQVDVFLEDQLRRAQIEGSATLALMSNLGTKVQAKYDVLRESRTAYAAVGQSRQRQWGWFTALIYTKINFHRMSAGKTSYYVINRKGPSMQDYVELEGAGDAYEVAYGRTALS